MEPNPNSTCSTGQGTLPGSCADMVFPYVPMQPDSPKTYEQAQALEAGTLFPGLRLPFRKEIQERAADKSTPVCELMALDFAIAELGLYLDTHQDDKEAFALYTRYVKLRSEGKARYEKQYGPLQQTDTAAYEKYNWLKNPWPWEYKGGAE